MKNIRAPAGKEGAYDDYMSGMKYKTIAQKYGVSINTVKSWKLRYGWNRKEEQGAHTKNKCDDATAIEAKDIGFEQSLEINELPIKHEIFCLHYVRNHNATQAALNAGYAPESAHITGCRLLKDAKVAEHIKRLKADLTADLFIDAKDVLNQYIKIAFSDIKDYVEYETVQQVIDAGSDNELTLENDIMKLKPSRYVDGQIIAEVKRGKNGISIKLEDRIKALDRLAQMFDMFPDEFQRRILEKRLELKEAELQIKREAESKKGW